MGHVLAIVLLLLGLSYLLLYRKWMALFRRMTTRPAEFISLFILMLLGGLLIALGYNDWTETWHIFVTAFGWLLAIEGGLLLLFPGLLKRFSGIPDRFLAPYILFGGVLLLILGSLLARHFFT